MIQFSTNFNFYKSITEVLHQQIGKHAGTYIKIKGT